MKMEKGMVSLLVSCWLLQLGLGSQAFAGDEDFELLRSLRTVPQHSSFPIAVLVNEADIPRLSASVLHAESWLRRHVLSHYPSSNISTIVVGSSLLCSRTWEEKRSLLLFTMKNLHHSLLRWGLHPGIRVSAAFSDDCLSSSNNPTLKPVLTFLQISNNFYSIIPPRDFSPHEASALMTTHSDFIKKLGFSGAFPVNIILPSLPRGRELSSTNSDLVEPYPARPTPLRPLHSSVGVKNPVSPTSQVVTPPEESFTAPPIDVGPPIDFPPANPPADGLAAPPCLNLAPAPEQGEERGLWCVAKPSVPAATLQEALDFACGAGGADCEEIAPDGSCYFPDNVVAHASYAFNSYWQKNKRNGGTCSFRDTAMIINSDPSFHHCRFTFS